MNDTIIRLIKNARIEMGKTQKDLADALNKTPAAISDMERGKVQVSASELYTIAQLLNKPIEYFYNEEVGDSISQEIIFGIRSLPSKDRSDIYRQTRFLLDLKKIEIEARQYPTDKKIPVELIQNYYNRILPITASANELNERINKIHDMLEAEMEKTGLKRAGKKK